MAGVFGTKAGDIGGKLLALTAAFGMDVMLDPQALCCASLKKLRTRFGIGAGIEARWVHVRPVNLRLAETGMAL